MAFSGMQQVGGTTAGANNFRQAWSEEITRKVFRMLVFRRRFLAAFDRDAETNDVVFAQNPNYNVKHTKGIDTSAGSATNILKKAAWGTPNEPSALRIAIPINRNYRTENMLYVEDELVNAYRGYRADLEAIALHQMAQDMETDAVAYLIGLATETLTGTPTATANGNAGDIRLIAKGPTTANANVGFSHTSGRPTGNNANTAESVRQWPLEVLEEAQVYYRENDLSDPGLTIGGAIGRPWCIMPPAIYSFGLAAELESKGISLDFTRQVIQNTGIFGTAFAGNWKGFDLYTSNSLTRPGADTAAAAANVWNMFIGHDSAIAGPMRRIRNYVTLPQNTTAERTEFRHVTNGGLQLVNNLGVIKATFHASN